MPAVFELRGTVTASAPVTLPILTGHSVARITNLSTSGPQLFARADSLTTTIGGAGATPVGPGETIELRISGAHPHISLAAATDRAYLVTLQTRFSPPPGRILRRPAGDWAAENPILADGQVGYDETSLEFRVGDGVHHWNALTPIGGAPAGGLTAEQVQDIVGAMVEGDNIAVTYNDAAGTITLTAADNSLALTTLAPIAATQMLGRATSGTGPVEVLTAAQANAIVAPGVINVRHFGAVGNGVADDTAAFQAAIAACIGAGDPATTARRAVAELHVPAGTYLVLPDQVAIRSVLGFHLRGAGKELTRLRFSTAGTVGLDLDGCAYSRFEGLSLEGPSSGAVDKLLHLHWGAGAYRSVTACELVSMRASAGNWRTAFAIGTDNANQVDNCRYEDVEVLGSWTTGNTLLWQYGFEIGNNTVGNNLGHHIHKYECGAVRYGAAYLGTSGSIKGGFGLACDTDLYRGSPNSELDLTSWRSEGSARLFVAAGPSSAGAVTTIRDCEFNCNAIAADGQFIICGHSGMLRLDNIKAAVVSTPLPTVRMNGSGRSVCSVDGFLQGASGTLAQTFIAGGAHIEFRIYGFLSLDSSGAATAVSPPTFFGEPTMSVVLGGAALISGSGSPEGAVSASTGTLYMRTGGGVGTSLYVKETGTGNTGWAAK